MKRAKPGIAWLFCGLALTTLSATTARADLEIPYATFSYEYAITLGPAERTELDPIVRNDGAAADEALSDVATAEAVLSDISMSQSRHWGQTSFELEDSDSFCASQYPKLAMAMTRLGSEMNMQSAGARRWVAPDLSPALDAIETIGSHLCECSFWCLGSRKAADILNEMKAQLAQFRKKERSISEARSNLERADDAVYQSEMRRMDRKQAEIIQDLGDPN